MIKPQRTAGALASLALALFSLSSCGEDSIVSQDDIPQLVQHMFVLPDRLTGQPYLYTTPTNVVYLDTNETVKFWAAYSLNSQYLTSDNAENHYLNHSWTIDDEVFNISPLRYKFPTPGAHRGILQTVDLLGDTLSDTLDIFVNTPISVRAIAPVNGFNQADPTPQSEIELQWELSGVDSWEKARCFAYASFDAEDVWTQNIGEVDCFSDTRIVGTYFSKKVFQDITDGKSPDSSVTIYWGIKASLTTDRGFIERDSTEVFHYSTRYIRTEESRIDIPVVYEDLRHSDIHIIASITNAFGDTLATIDTTKVPITLHATIEAQTTVHINIRDAKRTEYKANDILLNVQPGTQILLDTVKFTDTIQPQVAQLSPSKDQRDTVIFYALDNGSGINPKKIFVTANTDTLEHIYEEPFIKFRNTCAMTCKVRISVEDYAHNVNPRVYWNLNPGSNKTEGPFSELGGDP